MFGTKKSLYGLDIGTQSIKCVELEKTDDIFELKNYVIEDIYPEGVQYDAERENLHHIVSALSTVFQNMKINPKKIKNISSSIGGPSVNIKQIKTVSMSEADLENSLRFEARKHLPITGSQMILDYQILEREEEEDKKESDMDVLIVVTDMKTFQSHVKLLNEVELSPRIVDVDILACMNSYLYYNPAPIDEILIFLDIGAERTKMSVFDPVGLIFFRDLAYAGNNFSNDIMKEYEVDFDVAERIKKEKGIFTKVDVEEEGSGSKIKMGKNISLAEKMAHESLIEEINRSLRYYYKESGKNNYSKVILTGGSSKIPSIDAYLSGQLNLPVEIYNPFEDMQISGKLDIIEEPQLSQAVGLALHAG